MKICWMWKKLKNTEFTVLEDENNIRIDKALSVRFKDVSRSHLQNLIENGSVKVNDKNIKSNYKLKINDRVRVEIPEPVSLTVEPEDIDINILYEDSDIIVVDKIQGMVVHPAPGNYSGTLVNALLYHCKDLSGINGILFSCSKLTYSFILAVYLVV